jgi:uncharacterized protein
VSAPRTRRPLPHVEVVAPAPPPTEATASSAVPFLLDFLPRQGEADTRLSRFFSRLRDGRLSSTRCRRDGTLTWPPRTVCPKCHAAELDWVDLPGTGRLYAFSAVLAGAPLGMEKEVPFSVALVDLDGAPLRLFGRVVGRPWNELRVGGPVTVETYAADDGRWFYRFRAAPDR